MFRLAGGVIPILAKAAAVGSTVDGAAALAEGKDDVWVGAGGLGGGTVCVAAAVGDEDGTALMGEATGVTPPILSSPANGSAGTY